MVVRTHDQDRVFDGDDDNQGPKDQGDDSQNGLRGYLTIRSCRLHGHTERIERASADVAKDNAHASKCGRCPGSRMACLVEGAVLCHSTHESGPPSRTAYITDLD